MPTVAPPELIAFMDAYKVLGVDSSADSAAISQAHKRLAKQHHPDRFPVGSAEQQQATAHMAAINDAYRLIQQAPLRYHGVSKASDPTTPWTDTECDEGIARERTHQKVDRRMTDVENVDRWMTLAMVALIVAVPICTSSVAVFRTPAVPAFPVPQAALRQTGPVTRLSTEERGKKISVQELELQLIESSSYSADAKLRCEPTTAGWDYICSYTPTGQTLFPRLHFGVNVDSKRVLQISQPVPLGVPIPPLGL